MQPRLGKHPAAALTLVETLAVLFLILLLAAVFLPMLAEPQKKSSRIDCINNLKEIGLACKIWEQDYGDKFPYEVSVTNGGTMEVSDQAWRTFQVMSNVLCTPKILVCPNDAARPRAATNFTADLKNHLSYFVGLDGDDSFPLAILSGDDNLPLNGTHVPSGLVTITNYSQLSWIPGRHSQSGYVGFADGSAQDLKQFNSTNTYNFTSTNQIHLAIP